ncbi:50S ribosomal protein L5 [Candidatus Gottesmanbacteria bacterium]|nr:50S ribosomal protein L5 [Candidatus Gottesmanbacteria bacterium]
MPSLQKKYQEIIPTLKKEMGLKNIFMVPKITKIVINIGLGEALTNKKSLDTMTEELSLITGQKPIKTYAKKAISTFKLQQGQSIGLKVTLRGGRMYAFLDKIIKVVLPRIRDFRGVGDNFDARGNFTIGFTEHIVFPEIDYAKVDKIRGFEVTLVTTGKNKEETKRLLTLLGVPFKK